MSSTIRCSRDGKEYPSSEVVTMGSGVYVAKVNLTDEEKKALGLENKPMGEEETKAPEQQPENQPTGEGQPTEPGAEGQPSEQQPGADQPSGEQGQE